jgi:hypothetical protein
MNKPKKVRFQKGGSALLLVVFAVVILAITGAGLLDVGLNSTAGLLRYGQPRASRRAPPRTQV